MADDLDWDKLEEVALALLCLTKQSDRLGSIAWKSLDWNLMERLHERGWIDDPKSKRKSVVFSEEGSKRADEMLDKHFRQTSG